MPLGVLLETGGDDEFLAIGLLVLIFLGGLYLVYIGFKKYRVGRLIKNTATERVRSVAMGRTELKGRVNSAGETFEAPFTDDECVFRGWEIEEEREYQTTNEDGETETKRKWVTIDSGTDAAPFYLEDDTAEIFVMAVEGADFTISSENRFGDTLSTGRSFPPAVRTFMQQDTDVTDPMQIVEESPFADAVGGHQAEVLTPREYEQLTEDEQALLQEVLAEESFEDGRLADGVDAVELGERLRPLYEDEEVASDLFGTDDGGGGLRSALRSFQGVMEKFDGASGLGSSNRVKRRRYSQRILPLEEEIYLLGGAEPRPDAAGSGNEDLLAIQADSATGEFIVSDKEEGELVSSMNRKAPLFILGGLALSAGTLYVLLTAFGPF